MRRHVCEAHTHAVGVKILDCDVIQSHRAAAALVTHVTRVKKEEFDVLHYRFSDKVNHKYAGKRLNPVVAKWQIYVLHESVSQCQYVDIKVTSISC